MAIVTKYGIGPEKGGYDTTTTMSADPYTNSGHTSTGRNLTPGCVAVGNPSQYGTIYKNSANGQVYIATDLHGNSNKAVIDMYYPPSQYREAPGMANLDLVPIGKIPRSQIPKTPEGIQSLLANYGKVPPGESAKDFLEGKEQPVPKTDPNAPPSPPPPPGSEMTEPPAFVSPSDPCNIPSAPGSAFVDNPATRQNTPGGGLNNPMYPIGQNQQGSFLSQATNLLSQAGSIIPELGKVSDIINNVQNTVNNVQNTVNNAVQTAKSVVNPIVSLIKTNK